VLREGRVYKCMCVCVLKRERKRECHTKCLRERERETVREGESAIVSALESVCVRVCRGERKERQIEGEY
jgi:hypothetical protein